MRTLRRSVPPLVRVVSSLVAGLCAMRAVTASPMDPPPGPDTAIDHYRSAFEWWRANVEGGQATLTQADIEILCDTLHGPPTPKVRESLAKVAPFIDALRAGGLARAYGDPLDRRTGIHAGFHQLGSWPDAPRVLRLDAQVHLADGDAAGAVERLAAISGFAAHSRQDRLLASSLVSGSILELNDAAIGEAIGSGTLDPLLAGRLADALDPLRGPDPLMLGDALRDAAGRIRESVEQALKEGRPTTPPSDAEESPIDPAELTPDRLAAQCESIDALCRRAADAMAQPDHDAARARLAEIQASIDGGEAGPLAKRLLPALDRAVEMSWRTERIVAARWAALDELRADRSAVVARLNAANAYLHVDELVRSLDVADREAVEAVRLAGGEVGPETAYRADAALRRIRPRLHELFDMASRSPACDFTISHETRPALLPAYVVGLRGGVHVLLADASRAAERATSPAPPRSEGANGSRDSPTLLPLPRDAPRHVPAPAPGPEPRAMPGSAHVPLPQAEHGATPAATIGSTTEPPAERASTPGPAPAAANEAAAHPTRQAAPDAASATRPESPARTASEPPAGSVSATAADPALGTSDPARTADAPWSEGEAIAACLRAVRHLTMDPSLGHSAYAALLLRDASSALADATAAGRISAADAAFLLQLASSLPSQDPAGFTKAIEADRAALAKELSRDWSCGVADAEADLLRRGPTITQALLVEQLAAILKSAYEPGADHHLDTATVERVTAQWLDERRRSAPLLAIGDILGLDVARSSVAIVDALRNEQPDGAVSAREAFRRGSWVDVLELGTLRSSASDSFHAIGERLQALLDRAGQVPMGATPRAGSDVEPPAAPR